jgi:hypothetical protein
MKQCANQCVICVTTPDIAVRSLSSLGCNSIAPLVEADWAATNPLGSRLVHLVQLLPRHPVSRTARDHPFSHFNQIFCCNMCDLSGRPRQDRIPASAFHAPSVFAPHANPFPVLRIYDAACPPFHLSSEERGLIAHAQPSAVSCSGGPLCRVLARISSA